MVLLKTKFNLMRNFIRTILSLSFILTFGYSALSQGAPGVHVLTFKVSAANITVGPNGLYLGGGIIGGADAVQLTDPDGNGVYEGTDTLSGAGGGKFIFLNSPAYSTDWNTKEIIQGLPCSDPNNWDDRTLPSFTQDTTLLFCFGTCATDTICPAPWVSTGPLSGVYTINANSFGARNYTSITAAIADLDSLGVNGAVTFNVASGIYDEQINLGEVTGASSVNKITFFGDVGNAFSPTVLTYTPVGTSDNWTVKMTGTDYITFDNITITSGSSSYARLIVYTDTVTNFNLTNCHLTGATVSSTSTNYAGLYYEYPAVAGGTWHVSDNVFDSVSYAAYVYGTGYGAGSGADSVFIEDNTINATYYGFYTRYARYSKVHDNTINSLVTNGVRNYVYYPILELDVQGNQVNDGAYGIYVYTAPPTSGATGGIKATISNNHFEGNYYGIRLGGSGSATTEKLTDVTIENNTIEGWGSSYNYGIYLAYVDASATNRAKIQNNMISLNTTSTTGTLYGIYPYHCANVDMHHNSIAANGGSLTNSRLIYLNHSTSTSYFTPGGNDLSNNAVTNLNGGKNVVGQTATTGSAAYCTTSNNLFYTTNTTPHTNFTPATSDLTGDPMYMNPLTDLHAQGQVADNAGTPVGVLTDIDGDTRSTTTPDIGADEFAYVSQCFAPTAVTTSNVTSTSFDASWTSANTPIGYHARAWAAGTTTYMYSSGTGSTASFSGLMANTTYSVEVRDICAVGDTSGWSGTAGSATTLCSSITVTQGSPFIENFDGTSWVSNTSAGAYNSGIWDDCWTVEPTFASYPWQINSGVTASNGTGPLGANSGLNYIYYESSGSGVGNSVVVKTPSLYLSTVSPQLSFAYHMYGVNQDAIYVDISTDSGASFTMIDSVTSIMANQSDPWAIHYTDLSSYVNTTVIIAFRVIRGPSYRQDAAIDDVSVGRAISCLPATALTTSNETSSSFDASWTTGNTAAIGYELRYAVDPMTATSTWTSVSGTGTSASITGLTSGTGYMYEVREICAVGDTGAWSTHGFATTMVCPLVSQCDYTITMTDSYGDGWNGCVIGIEQKNAAGQWVSVGSYGSNFTSGSSDTALVGICPNDSVRVVCFQPGSYSSEVGFVVYASNGDTLATELSGGNFYAGDVFGTGISQCLVSCFSIYNLTSDNITDVSFDASWYSANQSAIGYELRIAESGIPAHIPQDGLVGWWPFNGNVNDESGNGNNGIATNVNFTTGQDGGSNNAISLSGNGYVEIPQSSSLYLNNHTVSFYYKSTLSTLQLLINKATGGGSASNEAFSFSLDPVGNYNLAYRAKFNGNCQSGAGWYAAGNTSPMPTSSVYHHVVGVSDNDSLYLYVDGQLVTKALHPNVGMDSCNSSIWFGRDWPTNSAYNFTGELDDIAIWNRALSSQDIQDIHNAPASYTYYSGMGTSASITGLSPYTDYVYSVREICSIGDTSAWADATASTTLCNPSDQCSFTLNMTDSYGDGWNGCVIGIEQRDPSGQWISIATAGENFISGSTASKILKMCSGDSARIVCVNNGSYSYEVGFTLINFQGDTIASKAPAVNSNGNFASGDLFATIWSVCPQSCPIDEKASIPTTYLCGPQNVVLNDPEFNPYQELLWLNSSQQVVYSGMTHDLGIVDSTRNVLTRSYSSDTLPAMHVGAPTNLFGGFSNSDNGTWFTVESPLTIDSIKVKSNGALDFQVNISEAKGNSTIGNQGDLLQQSSLISVSASGIHKVPVGIILLPGQYFMNISFSTNTSGMLHRAVTGATYPYAFSNVISIDSVDYPNQTRAYYAYDWVVSQGCAGPLATSQIVVKAGADTSVTVSGSLDFCSYDDVTLTAAAGQTYLWSNGATTQSITVNQAGVYSAIVTTTNGCVDTTATYTTTVFADADTSVTVSGSLDFCSYDDVTLTAAAGQTYLWSNGATTQSITVSQAGVYSAVVTTTNGCSDTTATYTTTVFTDADTSVTASGPLDFCSYDDVTLTAAAGQSYAWNTGDTSQAITSTMAGAYSVIVTTSDGCTDTTVDYNTTIFADADTSVVVTQTLFCASDSAILIAAPGQSYLWNNGDTTQASIVNSTGDYFVTATTTNGCAGSSDTTSITVVPDVIVPQIVSNGLGWVGTGSSTSLTIATDSTQTYQWNVDGGVISSGQGTDSLVVTWGIPDTSVTVWLVITNGVCTDSTSIEFVISGIGFEDTDLANAKLYPNPNDGYFTVEVPEQYIGSEMNVIDGIGRVIEHMVIQEMKTNIDLRRRPKGVYRIQIKSKEGIKTIPVVMQ